MAHLLGSRYCIESLHTDVGDLQAVVVEVFSRTGPVTQPSWKYPDKAANNVNVAELLDIYVYTEDEEERQVAHIVLLELVIDRLLVLLQAMSKYLDGLLSRAASAAPVSNSTSVGLVVKKYWNKMVHVHTVTKQLQSESKTKSRKIQELEQAVEQLSDALDTLRSGTGEAMLNLSGNTGRQSVNPDVLLPGGMDSASLATLMSLANSKKKVISKDECNKSSQTIETSFVPCEVCSRVQQNLRAVGKEFVSIFRNQELPSLLDRHMDYVKDLDWMTHNDITRWTTEQNKDLVKLNKHLKQLRSTIDPLEQGLAKEQEKTQKLQEKVSTLAKDLALERETQSIQLSQFEGKVDQARAEKQKEIDIIKKEKTQLTVAKSELESQLQTLRKDLTKAQGKVKEYERSQKDLEEELERSQTDNAEIRRLRDDLAQLECQLDKTRGKLSDTSRELNKERARSKSVNKHTESLQGKQGTLLQRIDTLAEENEALRGELSEAQEDKDRLEEALSRARAEQRTLEETGRNGQSSVKKLKQENSRLETTLTETQERLSAVERALEEAREQQRLIVEYPDLNGPVNKDISGTGNIATDMENQVRANSVRIKVLEDQNNGLRNTITRMMQLQNNAHGDSENIPLWKQTNSHVTRIDVMGYDQEEGSHPGGGPSPSPYHHRPRATSPYQHSPASDNDSEDDRLFYRRKPSSSTSQRPPVKAKPGERDWVPPDTFTVKQAPKPRGLKSGKPRPVSAKPALGTTQNNMPSTSSISAYVQLKRSGMIKSAGPSGRSRASSAKALPDGYKKGDPITCDKCDKTYMHIKDLQIHKNYCFGGS